LSEQQTGFDEAVERQSQLCLRLAHHRSQQSMRELAPDCRADLRDFLRGAKPVKPRHEQ
jgi:hypothetical protein